MKYYIVFLLHFIRLANLYGQDITLTKDDLRQLCNEPRITACPTPIFKAYFRPSFDSIIKVDDDSLWGIFMERVIMDSIKKQNLFENIDTLELNFKFKISTNGEIQKISFEDSKYLENLYYKKIIVFIMKIILESPNWEPRKIKYTDEFLEDTKKFRLRLTKNTVRIRGNNHQTFKEWVNSQIQQP